jgi:hypothetical protein
LLIHYGDSYIIIALLLTSDLNTAAVTPASTKGQSHVGFRFSRYKKIVCDLICSCVYHRKHRNSSPRMLRQIIGQIFWAYAGVPLQKGACNESGCRQQQRFTAHVTYYFPQWFISRMSLVTLSQMTVGNPVASLYLRNALLDKTVSLNYIEHSDMDDIKALVNKRSDTLNDIY